MYFNLMYKCENNKIINHLTKKKKNTKIRLLIFRYITVKTDYYLLYTVLKLFA